MAMAMAMAAGSCKLFSFCGHGGDGGRTPPPTLLSLPPCSRRRRCRSTAASSPCPSPCPSLCPSPSPWPCRCLLYTASVPPQTHLHPDHPLYYHIPTRQGIPVGTKLSLHNLPSNCDTDALIHHLNSRGASSVHSIQVSNHPTEGNAFGYVTLGSLDQACAVVAQLDGETFQGRCVRIDFVKRERHVNIPSRMSASKPKNGNRVYIGNLPWRMNDITLQQLFSAYGTVLGAKVVREEINGRSRGFGFVVMSTSAEMERAIAMLDGSEIAGQTVRVSAAISQEKSS